MTAATYGQNDLKILLTVSSTVASIIVSSLPLLVSACYRHYRRKGNGRENCRQRDCRQRCVVETGSDRYQSARPSPPSRLLKRLVSLLNCFVAGIFLGSVLICYLREVRDEFKVRLLVHDLQGWGSNAKTVRNSEMIRTNR